MAPRTAEQNQVLRHASRERILAAALRLFSQHGYAATSIRMIAEAAGVAQGLMYSHFEGKEELLRSLFRRCMDDVRASFAAAGGDPAGPPDGRTPLERLVASALQIIRRNLDFWRLSYGVRMQEEVVKALGPDLRAWTRTILTTLEAHFRASGAALPGPGGAGDPAGSSDLGGTKIPGGTRSPGGSLDPRIEAALFFAAFDGMCQHFVLDPKHYPLDAVSRGLLARFTPPATSDRAASPRPKGDSHGKRRRR